LFIWEKFQQSPETVFTSVRFCDIIKMLGLAGDPFGIARSSLYSTAKNRISRLSDFVLHDLCVYDDAAQGKTS
jgi:hypothetical protein